MEGGRKEEKWKDGQMYRRKEKSERETKEGRREGRGRGTNKQLDELTDKI